VIIANLMTGYFAENADKNSINNNVILENNMPVNVKTSDWYISDTSIKKVYDIEDQKKREAFIVQLIRYVRKTPAKVEVRFCDERVGIIITARSPEISEIDLEAKNDIVDIKKDVEFYYNENLKDDNY
jgi:hypothetical protein